MLQFVSKHFPQRPIRTANPPANPCAYPWKLHQIWIHAGCMRLRAGRCSYLSSLLLVLLFDDRWFVRIFLSPVTVGRFQRPALEGNSRTRRLQLHVDSISPSRFRPAGRVCAVIRQPPSAVRRFLRPSSLELSDVRIWNRKIIWIRWIQKQGISHLRTGELGLVSHIE